MCIRDRERAGLICEWPIIGAVCLEGKAQRGLASLGAAKRAGLFCPLVGMAGRSPAQVPVRPRLP
eukprot:9328843-Pyramimonas_sp.AAC.1